MYAHDQPKRGDVMSDAGLRRRIVGLALSLTVVGLLLPASAFAADATQSKATPVKGAAVAEPNDTLDNPAWLDDVDTTGTHTENGSAGGVDVDDVFAVWLAAGEQLSISLIPPAGSDWGIDLYSPYALTLNDPVMDQSVKRVANGGPGGSPLETSFYAGDTGYYFVDVSADNGTGDYQLIVTVTRRDTDVRISTGAQTMELYRYPIISGTVVDRLGQSAIGDVYLYSSYDLLDWWPVAGVGTGAGEFTFYGEYQNRKTYYMVTFEGNDNYCTNSQTTKAYPTKGVLKNPVARSTMKVGKKSTVYALLEPYHTAGTYPVRIQKYKKVGGKWKSYGYVKGKASKYNDWTSKCSVSMSLASKGSWRLRAYAPEDSKHAATWSPGYDYVTVK